MIEAPDSGWSSYHPSTPPVRQNYWNQLAGGYKLVTFFSRHDLSSVRAAGETNRAQAAMDALKMSAETMVALAGDGTAGRTKVSSPLITLREFPGGASASYHVFVNNSAGRYWGLPFNYGKAQVNYDNDALVRDDSVECLAEFSRKDRWLFDMSTGQPLGSTDPPLKLKIEPSLGMVVCALPFPSAQLRVIAPRSAKLGDVGFKGALVNLAGSLVGKNMF
ncbi:MAG: hypothetical protein ACOYOU_07540 [Kiritimatiellia bacterium]